MSERFDYDGLLEVNQTLSAENARLRGVLAEIQFDCEHLGGIQQLDKAERRTWVSVARRIGAALQPERGGGIQAAHVQACMECGKPVNDHQHLGSSISFHPTRKP